MSTTAIAPPSALRLDVPPLRFAPMVIFACLFGFTFGAVGWGLLIAAIRGAIPGHAVLPYLLFSLPFAAIGTYFLWGALALFLRRYTLTADPTGITITSHLLGFSRTRRFNTPTLRDIVLVVRPGSHDALCQSDILAALDTGQRTLLIRRYGATATARLSDTLRTAIFSPSAPTPQPATLSPQSSTLSPPPPPGGYLTGRLANDTLHLHLAPEPASQVGKNSLTTAWGLIIGASILSPIFISIGAAKDTASLWIMLPIILFIWIGIILQAAKLIRRTRRSAAQQADIACTPDTLSITLTGDPPTHLSWPAADLRSITLAPADLLVNNQPVFELQILSTQSPSPTSLFTGRDEDDLEWLAQTLATTLHLPTPESRRAALLQNSALSPAEGQSSARVPAIDQAIQNSDIRRLPADHALALQLRNATSLRAFFTDLLGSISFRRLRIIHQRHTSPLFTLFFAITFLLIPILILRSDHSRENILGSILFFLVGLFLLCLAYAEITATATFTLTPETLHIHSKILRSHHADLPTSHILAIRVASDPAPSPPPVAAPSTSPSISTTPPPSPAATTSPPTISTPSPPPSPSPSASNPRQMNNG